MMSYPEAMGWLKVHAPMEVQRAVMHEHLQRINLELRVESLVTSCSRWREEKNKAWSAAMKWKGDHEVQRS